jgi:hypothetical protein
MGIIRAENDNPSFGTFFFVILGRILQIRVNFISKKQ